MKKLISKVPLYAYTLCALLMGTAVGLWLGKQAAPLGVISKIVIEAVKYAAIPLIFLAITDGLASSEFRGKSIVVMFGISAFNACCAIAIGLSISHLFQAGRTLPLAQLMEAQHGAKRPVPAVTATGAIELFFSSPMILSILSGLIIGSLILTAAKSQSASKRNIAVWFASLTKRMLEKWIAVVGFILYFIPFAVFSSVAKVIGEHGFSMLHGLLVYLAVCLGGMLTHITVVYHTWILGVARLSFLKFWRAAIEPVAHAFGVNSSLATLPFTLRALEKIGVTPSSARLSACVGTNFNNDGILLYEVVAVLFLAQAYGIPLSLFQQLGIAVVCIVATIGVGGIPEAGIISLAIVLTVAGLPAESLTLLLTVDWLIARFRSVTNVLGDMTVAVGIDAMTKVPCSPQGLPKDQELSKL